MAASRRAGTAPLNRRVSTEDFVALLRALRRERPGTISAALLCARVTDAGILQLHIRLLFGPQPEEAEQAGGFAGHHFTLTVEVDPRQVQLRTVDAWAAANA